MSGRAKLFYELYQIAGGLLLEPKDGGFYTAGQRERLRELLLDALCNPERFTARNVRIARGLAVKE